jgi:hypothetical protein
MLPTPSDYQEKPTQVIRQADFYSAPLPKQAIAIDRMEMELFSNANSTLKRSRDDQEVWCGKRLCQ